VRSGGPQEAAVGVGGYKEGDPLRRVLTGTVTALRARQHLPRRDHRRAESLWVRPNWPDALLLSIHRNRLIGALAQDEALRGEVRDVLGLPDTPELATLRARIGEEGEPSTSADELLTAAMTDMDDPVALLEAAALDPDAAIAKAVSPYLSGQLPVPAAAPRTLQSIPDIHTKVADPEARRRMREANTRAKSTRKELRKAVAETRRLDHELSAAIERAQNAETRIAALRDQLPSRRERDALASASTQQDKIAELQRRLDSERAARRYDLHELRERLSEAEQALSLTQKNLDRERRGRHGLEAQLGDTGAGARRLKPLTERESASLRQQALGMSDGTGKTRILRRADSLRQLSELLSELYEHDTDGRSAQGTTRGQRMKARVLVSEKRSRGLIVTPLGGANHIGGSALLIEAGGTRLLVDAGLKPQAHISHPGPDRISEAVAGHINAVVVTHAHADHAGFVPWVVERQRRTAVLCSPETKALLPTVWADSVRVMRADADAASQRREHFEPPYGDTEVEQAEEALHSIGYGQSHVVGDLELTLFRAGHILGAAGVVVRAGDQRVVITGDIDNRRQASVGAAEIPPRLAAAADLLVIETTYCDAIHRDRAREGDDLVRRAEEVLQVGGRILVPAFGLGRAQEIALLLGERLPNVDVLVDGLARDISELYSRNGAPEVLQGRVRKVIHREREILGFHEGIVITTSGMLTGGAAIPWARAVLLEPDSALFLCGHQDEEAPGHELEKLADADPDRPRSIRLRDEHGKPVDIDVASAVYKYNLSAHADRNGLKGIIDLVHPKAIMLVHGEPGPQALFRARLNAAGYRVVDNREPWDADAVIPDDRLARHRHQARGRGHRVGGH
jgi:Cft2 family RNA processing exonuclease